MSIFDVLTLFGGLAMFLYGMRLMGDALKEGSSGALKKALESVTNNAFKAFLLGMGVTAIIQSSTATIVITSGLVAAGILSLKQSLGIIVGANVGTTITGQIIRLIGVNETSTSWLQFFKPSTLSSVALIIGIVLIMGFKFKRAKTIGSIAIGFGILFSGLLYMTSAVDSLSDTGVFDSMFSRLGENPFLGLAIGTVVSFVLQSASAAIGILQAFSASGDLTFSAVYSVIVGVYLGVCVTTAIVCSIGAKAEQKRVGIINILYNLSKGALVLLAVAILKYLGVLDGIWHAPATPGSIANANTLFNLICALILLPVLNGYLKLSKKIIKDDPEKTFKYQDKVDALNPAFISTPAIALRSCYDALLTMFYASRESITLSLDMLEHFDEATYKRVQDEEDNVDHLADRVSEYLILLSSKLTSDEHVSILNHYYKIVNEFERLGDHAKNIADTASELFIRKTPFSKTAIDELNIVEELINRILDHAEEAFKRRDVEAAYAIEPLEEVVDDLVVALRDNHMARLSKGLCNIIAGTDFMDVLGDIERISDICSNVGLATVGRVHPELANKTHDYTYFLHSGKDLEFNKVYEETHKEYLDKLKQLNISEEQ